MKKFFSTLVLSLSLMMAVTPRANALVGIYIGSTAVMALGGLVAATGGVWIAKGPADHERAAGRGFSLKGLLFIINGIILLDGDQAGEIEFTAMESSEKFSEKKVAIYNSELAELNAIHQTVQAELEAGSAANGQQLWAEYGSALSQETLEIAGHVGQKLLNSIE